MIEIVAAQAMGILEYPAEPDDLETAASIWRLALMDVILQLPGASRIRFAQGLMGAPTPKPTDLLIINMNHMLLQLHQHRVCSELPRARAVGCDALGHWSTTILKEYPLHCVWHLPTHFLQASRNALFVLTYRIRPSHS